MARSQSSGKALVLGADFGTEAVRVLLLDVATAREVGVGSAAYAHGVIDRVLPDGTTLPADWALQDADDYLQALAAATSEALAMAGGDGVGVRAMAVDATCCTVVPALSDGTPLSRLTAFRGRPHAWTKLWKHHGARTWAERLTEGWSGALEEYGQRMSSEWLIPKVWEVLEEDAGVFTAADVFVEAQDWITWQLTGVRSRSSQAAGFKANYRVDAGGYPTVEALDRVAAGLSEILVKITDGLPAAPGTQVGELAPTWATRLGLAPGIPVAAGTIDAQGSLVGVGVDRPGRLVVALGTSACDLLLAESLVPVPGMGGAVRDGILPGWWAYDAGQAAVGDMFGWFRRSAVAPEVQAQARAAGLPTLTYLEHRAAEIASSEVSVLALDWWSGNRTPLNDSSLSGALLGLTTTTSPAQIYRALLEGAAFGQRRIIEAFASHGLPVEEIVACGGLSHRSPTLLQLLADLTGLTVRVAASREVAARGAAVHAAAAAGPSRGGYDGLHEATTALADARSTVYEPRRDDALADRYAAYLELSTYLGTTNPSIMRGLKGGRSREVGPP